MNILTLDIEDWYNCDFISGDFDWDKHEVRIYEGVIRLKRRKSLGFSGNNLFLCGIIQ